MPLSNFDRYFLNLPPPDKKSDFDQFWEKSIAEIKKIPLETELIKNARKTSHRFTSYDVSYKGYTKSTVTGELLVPRDTPKPKVIIHIHDYNSIVHYPQQLLDATMAYFFIPMRGHANIIRSPDSEEDE